ncbi:MFS transporter [Devosia sp. ZB163]|uniref:MFS transporter n=1 Tax=Devosia sp. ZB163 TaxID=3025938 RepID=UPI00235F26C2|nr:MFS transporter [Devosia sp. ZB163]MDC9825618.1 MFS transporter [Devosia sp. ZB163]
MDWRAMGALAVLSSSIFLEGVDVAMLNVALPAIRAELGLETTTLSFVVSAYVLGYAGFLLLGGRVADLFGRRRMFLAALVTFIAFSALGGVAQEGWLLLVSRFVTGMSAAFMTPAALSLITTNFAEGPQRNRAVLIYASTGSAGFAMGLVLGGLLTAINWRWVFFAPVIVATGVLPFAFWLLRDSVERPARMSFDFGGAITLTAAMLLAAFGVTRLEHAGTTLWVGLACLGGSVVLAALFVTIERTVREPLVRLGVFRSGSLVRANLIALLFIGSFMGFQFLTSLYLQEVLGWTALETSLTLLVMAIDVVLAPLVSPWFVRRLGSMGTMFGGLLLASAAYLIFVNVGLDWSYLQMLPMLVLVGLAFTLVYGVMTIVATEGVGPSEQGLASGLLNTSVQFGAALGLSAVSAVMVLNLGGADTTGARLEALRWAYLLPASGVALGALIAFTGLRSARRSRAAQ